MATYTKTAEIPLVQGGWLEFGQVSIDPASVAAAARGLETCTVTGAKTGDQVFVNAQVLPAMIAVTGGKITAANTLTLYYNNMYDATTAVDVGSTLVDVMILHLS